MLDAVIELRAAEYLDRGWVKGPQSVWCTLYAALRAEDEELAFVQDFLATARETCMQHLNGIRAAGNIGPAN